MSWQLKGTPVSGGYRFEILSHVDNLSFADLLERWSGASFADWYSHSLGQLPYPAFYLEHPPLRIAELARPAEFVVLAAPALARRRPDVSPFTRELRKREQDGDIAFFPNLGGDAHLVVPQPVAEPSSYGHLAAFLRDAPRTQVRALWHMVAERVGEHLSPSPIWLNTAGLGVSWLHVRLDSMPKYYRHPPYRETPPPLSA